MAVIETRALWNDIVKGVDARFAEVFNQTIDSYKSDASRIFKMQNDDSSRMRHTGKTNSGFVTKFSEGANVGSSNRQKTYDTEYIFENFGDSIEVTKNQIMDNDWEQQLDEMADLANGIEMTKDQNMGEVLNDGFITTSSTTHNVSRYGDAVPLFSTIHPRKDGGTAQSNASDTGLVLNEDNLNTGLIALAEQLSDTGTPMMTGGKPILVVPPALTRAAIQITQSELDANTANNNINYYKGVIADVVEIKYLATVNGGLDTTWFLVAPDRAKLFMITRQAAELNRDVDPKNFNRLFTADARWAAGHSDWRHTWGSKGDGAAYSS